MNVFDPGLPQLGQVLEPLAATRLLQDVLTDQTGAGSRVVGVELLKHRPGRRCALAYSIEGPRGRARLFAKAFARDRGQTVFRTTRRLGKALTRNEVLRVPHPIVWLDAQRLLVTEFVEGTRLLHYNGGSAEAAGRIADALGVVHRLKPHGKRRWDLNRELETTLRWAAELRTRRPDLRRAVTALERTLEARCKDIREVVTGLVHRDLYPEQFIDAAGQTILLDWDDARAGDGAVDAGNLLAHLRLRAIQFPESEKPCREARACFLERYRPPDIDCDAAAWDARLHLYEATSLLRLAGVYAVRERWVDIIPQPAVAACEAVVQRKVMP